MRTHVCGQRWVLRVVGLASLGLALLASSAPAGALCKDTPFGLTGGPVGVIHLPRTLLDRTGTVIVGEGTITGYYFPALTNLSGQFRLECRAQLAPGPMQVWTAATTGEVCLIKDGLVSDDPGADAPGIGTDDWQERITPAGMAKLTCAVVL